MEKVIEPTFREKSVEKREETQCNNADLLSANPAKCVLGQSGNVIVQSTRNNTNGVFKTEKGDGFTVDEEEGESLEERDTQGRKNISTLTSRHYAGHVRVFKGNLLNQLIYFTIIFLNQKLNNLHGNENFYDSKRTEID